MKQPATDETVNEGGSEVSETAEIGHNSAVAVDQLKSIVARIERLEEEKAAIASDIGDVYAESKSNGYDIKALRTIIRLRKQSPDDRAAQEAVLDVYKSALGMLA